MSNMKTVRTSSESAVPWLSWNSFKFSFLRRADSGFFLMFRVHVFKVCNFCFVAFCFSRVQLVRIENGGEGCRIERGHIMVGLGSTAVVRKQGPGRLEGIPLQILVCPAQNLNRIVRSGNRRTPPCALPHACIPHASRHNNHTPPPSPPCSLTARSPSAKIRLSWPPHT